MIHATFKTTKSILALSCILLITSMLQSAPFVYVANRVSKNVSVIDITTNLVVDTIDLGYNSPVGQIAITPDAKTVYVPCFDGAVSTVQLIDTASRTLLPEIAVGVGLFAASIAIAPNGLYAYLLSRDSYTGIGFIQKINITDNSISAPISSAPYAANLITIAPNGLTAYLSMQDTIGIFDLTNDTFTAGPLLVTDGAHEIAVSPDNAYLYLAFGPDLGYLGVQFIKQYSLSNRLNPTFIQDIGYPSIPDFKPFGVTISADGKTLYVTSDLETGFPYSASALGTIDISNPLIPQLQTPIIDGTGTILDQPFLLALTPDQKSLYVVNYNNSAPSDTVAVFDTSKPLEPTFKNSTVVGTIPFGIAMPQSNFPPTNLSGCKTKNVFLLQTDYINKLTWSAPTAGAPTSYNIYRDAGLTDLAGTSTTLEFYDHGRNPNTIYTYYITSVDSSGNQSQPASVTVTSPC